MNMYIISWFSTASLKVWESECYASTPKEALAIFRAKVTKAKKPIHVCGIRVVDGTLSLQLVA